jgi:hypothetical protein
LSERAAGPLRVRVLLHGAEAAADNEVDAVRWLTPREALETLTYGRDAEIVKRVLGA